jgi:hypothetical protein
MHQVVLAEQIEWRSQADLVAGEQVRLAPLMMIGQWF